MAKLDSGLVKAVNKPESDHVRGYRRTVEDTGREHGLTTNSRSLADVISPTTLPMRTEIQCVPTRMQKGRQSRYPGMLTSPCNIKVTKRRADAEEVLDAASHSPMLEQRWYGPGGTMKHPALTSRRRRNDQEEEN